MGRRARQVLEEGPYELHGIPNDVNLSGNYDWFYEGFALYQSLKLAVGLNRIRFEDFLDTLHSVRRAVGLGAVRLFLADWGYNTVQDRARVQRAPDIALLSLARFTAPFSEWPPPPAAPAGT